MTSPAARFLLSVGQALATMGLYDEGHPARRRAADTAHEQFQRLQETVPQPVFSFLDREVVCGGEVLRELKEWEWAARLARVGIQRLEFTEPADADDFAGFLDELAERLLGTGTASAEARPFRRSPIRVGALAVRGEGERPVAAEPRTATIAYRLGEEVETIRWIHERVGTADDLPLIEADAVVRSLSAAMHGQQHVVLPLLELKTFDQYTTTHSINVAVLAMGLAEFRGLAPNEVRELGVAGLLHDLGKVRIPHEILVKPGALSAEERAVMQRHPSDGARIILERERRLDLAAVVAYEHHIMLDGGGYPDLRFHRECHHASKLVHVCDVYDALRTRRPYRDAWESERVLGYLAERAGTEFDPEIVGSFTAMMRRYTAATLPLDEAG